MDPGLVNSVSMQQTRKEFFESVFYKKNAFQWKELTQVLNKNDAIKSFY